jgi:lysophospholipase L1-like esterase
MTNQPLSSLAACVLCLLPLACSSNPFNSNASMEPKTISAKDSRFLYEGRFDLANPDAPLVTWQMDRISLDFTGPSIELLFDKAKGQNFFDCNIDSSTRIVEARESKPVIPATVGNLGHGRHHLVLIKRSEANAGTVAFLGVKLPEGGDAYAPNPPAYKVKMEFIGDSITVGACNEDAGDDQWDDRKTHNAVKSWSTMTANTFHADDRNIAVSGMGIVTGYVDQKAHEVWNRVSADPKSAVYDTSQWTPNVVFVCLGANDDSFPKTKSLPFPDNFTPEYVKLIQEIRAAYPKAYIVLLLGGMSGEMGAELQKAWNAAYTQLQANDTRISKYMFKHGSRQHPRVVDDRAMADELIAWLKSQDFMLWYR